MVNDYLCPDSRGDFQVGREAVDLCGARPWVEQVADSKDGLDYRTKVTAQETASTWQSLAFGPNYKAAYCLAVCPAGEDVIGPFLTDRPAFLKNTLRPPP